MYGGEGDGGARGRAQAADDGALSLKCKAMCTALVLIDLINDLIHPAGAMPTCATEVEQRRVLPAANGALGAARHHGWRTLLVKVGFSAGYPELPTHAPIFGRAKERGALRLGQWGTEFHAELAVDPVDLVLVNHRLSPFHGTALDTVLRARGIERLLLGGVRTAWALQAAAREGHDRSIDQLSRLASVVRVADLAGLAAPC
jgi:ureidoacrylate peracid hydrolase